MKIMDKLSTYAALLGVIGAIGGGFYTWGQFNSRLDAIESTPAVNLSPLKEKDKELNLKIDIFFKNNTLDAYNKTKFYKSKDIYNNQNLDLFNQIDLSVYNKEIYSEITLASYSQNDPVEVHRVQLQEAVSKTRRLQLELEAMKQ